MIDHALQHIVDELNLFISRQANEYDTSLHQVRLQHLDLSTKNSESPGNYTAINLINLSLDHNLKTSVNPIGKHSVYHGLGIFVFISACIDDYINAVRHLGYVVEFFNENNCMTSHSSNQTKNAQNGEILIISEFQTLSFEQLSHIRTILGGIFYPAVCYRIQIKINRHEPPQEFQK
jgi:hypothetical protein